MYFHVYSFKLQIHAHIYRSFIRHHKMLGVRIAKRKNEPQKPANPCGTKLRARIFFVNTLQKETPPTRVVFLFGALSICVANRPPAAAFIKKRRETRKGFPRKHPPSSRRTKDSAFVRRKELAADTHARSAF